MQRAIRCRCSYDAACLSAEAEARARAQESALGSLFLCHDSCPRLTPASVALDGQLRYLLLRSIGSCFACYTVLTCSAGRVGDRTAPAATVTRCFLDPVVTARLLLSTDSRDQPNTAYKDINSSNGGKS